MDVPFRILGQFRDGKSIRCMQIEDLLSESEGFLARSESIERCQVRTEWLFRELEIERDGSSSLRNVPSVALMIPAPIRTTSVAASVMEALPSAGQVAGAAAVKGTLTPGARIT